MTVAPWSCPHERTIPVHAAYAGSRPDAFAAESVRVCQDCGRFFVYARLGSVVIDVQFELQTMQQVQAAGRYVEYAEGREE